MPYVTIKRDDMYTVSVNGDDHQYHVVAGHYATTQNLFDTAFKGRLKAEKKLLVESLQKGQSTSFDLENNIEHLP